MVRYQKCALEIGIAYALLLLIHGLLFIRIAQGADVLTHWDEPCDLCCVRLKRS